MAGRKACSECLGADKPSYREAREICDVSEPEKLMTKDAFGGKTHTARHMTKAHAFPYPHGIENRTSNLPSEHTRNPRLATALDLSCLSSQFSLPTTPRHPAEPPVQLANQQPPRSSVPPDQPQRSRLCTQKSRLIYLNIVCGGREMTANMASSRADRGCSQSTQPGPLLTPGRVEALAVRYWAAAGRVHGPTRGRKSECRAGKGETSLVVGATRPGQEDLVG